MDKLSKFSPYFTVKQASSSDSRYLQTEFNGKMTFSYTNEDQASNFLKDYWTNYLIQALEHLDSIPVYENGIGVGQANRLMTTINPKVSNGTE